MVEITMNEAKERLMNASSALYGLPFYMIEFNDKSLKSRAYENHNSVVIKAFRGVDSNELTWNFIWNIYDVGDSDVFSALAEVKKESPEKMVRIDVYRIGEYDGELIFTCTGQPYTDSEIRPLTENDIERIRALVTVPDDDTDCAKIIGKRIETQIASIGGPWIHTLGIFDGSTLAGVVIAVSPLSPALVKQNKIPRNFIHINSVFVHRDYRGNGYASRLIKAATAIFPDAGYSYTCNRENLTSMASVKSAGYTLAGTWVVYDL